MCLKRIARLELYTPCGVLSGGKVFRFLKMFSKLIKAVVARCLYAVYTLLAVWRVTVALQEPLYWLLLFSLSLVAIEALHTIIARKGGEQKWVTPSVFFYLLCGVPSIWLLELKLLNDRLQVDSTETASSQASANNVININLSDEGWTLALEQILIFVLVFGKWIAPKGQMTRDQLSQLLLVTLGAGADIIELLESFNEEEVRQTKEIVYLVMSVWTWSLLQFCIVPTAVKTMPKPEEPLTIPEVCARASSRSTVNIAKENGGLPTKPNSLHSNNNISAKEETLNNKNNEGSSITVQPPNNTKLFEKVTEVKNATKKIRAPITRSQSEEVQSKNSGGTSTQGRKSKNLVKGASVGARLGRSTPLGNKNKVVLVSEQSKSNHSCNNGSAPVEMGKTAKNKKNPLDEVSRQVNIPQHTCGEGGLAAVISIGNNTNERGGEDSLMDKDPKSVGVTSSISENERMADVDTNGKELDSEYSSWDHEILRIHDTQDDLRLEDEMTAILSGERCFFCFCCFTEIWSLVMSMLFQDLPFLITRLFIMFHYKVVSHMTVFFTFKNIVIILLLLNRIRVVVLEEYKPWKKQINDIMSVKKRNAEILREERRRRVARGQRDEVKGYDGRDQDSKIGNQDYDVERVEETEHHNGNTGNGTNELNSKRGIKKPKWLFWRV